ncbi:type VII secretion protein EccE [Mycolicibacterium vinylchloridicum]|uniref:type VII secretion protein EccE n=1 Tax=Mycolicibacterium vinylchloridicum TaxID=2736928 RepID=UPI0015C745D7|nr:type VII secretion protein EccE [Mycolicibacterium vinylchloridicum]
MKSTFPIGLRLTWWRVILAFLFTVALLAAGTHLWHGPVALAVPITVAVLLDAALLITWRQETLAALAWGRLLRRHADPTVNAPVSSHRPRWTTDELAIRGDDFEALAVVAVDGPSHSPSVLDQHRVHSGVLLPVEVVARAVQQFDVKLAGIDIHSVGRRRAGEDHHHYAATYSSVIADYGAVGERSTWCVLRMRSRDNAGAVAARDSVAATLAACARRLAVELGAHGCPSRLVDAAELAELDTAIAGPLARGAHAQWSALVHPAGAATNYWLSPQDITTETLDRLWAPDTDATMTSIQLRPQAGGTVSVGMLVRYCTAGLLKEPPLRGLNPLSGQQEQALRATMLEPAVPALQLPHRALSAGEKLRAPIGATGILIGTTAKHHPMLVPLGDSRPGRRASVTVAGELALLFQIARRAAATGYRVAVVSSRPEHWRAAIAPGLRVVREVPDELPDNGRAMMVVYDHLGTTGNHPTAAVTVRAVNPGTASVADVHLEQDSNGTAVIRTAEFRYRLHIDVQSERNDIAAAIRRVA